VFGGFGGCGHDCRSGGEIGRGRSDVCQTVGEFRRNRAAAFAHQPGQFSGPFRDSPTEVRQFAKN